jgi:protein arginine kinase activator
MVCQQCHKKEANVHYTQIINGKKVEMYICSQCANERGTFSFSPQLSLGNLLWGFPGFGNNTGFDKFQQPGLPHCSVCGMSFDDFRKNGKLGCGNCYSVFKDNLDPILRRLHGSVEHIGKTPDKRTDVNELDDRIKIADSEFNMKDEVLKADADVSNVVGNEPEQKNKIDKLKTELSQAINCEHYEKAAELRDRIRELENSENVGGGAL